jgi:amino acid adenylation domain-containing protein
MTIETEPSAGGSEAPMRRLSFAQEQLWFLDQLAPGDTTYNLFLVWRLRGPLRVDVLRRCLDLVVARHETLRIRVRSADGVPFQVVAPPGPAPLTVLDLREVPVAEREDRVRAEVDALRAAPYDLAAGPLCRFRLLQVADEEFVFCQGFHHIATDGWSTAVTNRELSMAYSSLHSGVEPVFDHRASDYLEFAEAQRERLTDAVLAEELAYWRERLAELPVLELPSDRPRPVDGSRRGATVIRQLPEDLRPRVQELADEHGASMFMVLTAASLLVLSRYSGLTDIPIGVPMLGRPTPELDPVVGMFINMVVLRADLSGDPSFAELIERVADGVLDLYEHQEVPFYQVVEALMPVRDPGRNPLFQVGVQLLDPNTAGEDLSFPEVTAQFWPQAGLGSRFDIALNISDSGTVLRAGVEYSAEMFDAWRIEAMVGHLETVLRTAVDNPRLRLSEIPIVTGPEAGELLAAGRGEVVEPDLRPLHVAVAEVAHRQPDAIAVVCEGAELSYAELDRRSEQLARQLRGRGLRAGQVVAVVLERDLDAYVTMLGILKSGGCYAMLDPNHPVDRLAFMVEDTHAPLLISHSSLTGRLPQVAGCQLFLIDTDWIDTDWIDTDWPGIHATGQNGHWEEWAGPDSLAYILYTSGSTGQPKGVMIPHRAVSFFCQAFQRSFDFGPEDRLLQLPSLAFDMSQGEFWTAWLSGATVIAVSPEEASSPEQLATLMREQRVTYAGLPPAIQSIIDAGPYPELRCMMGGAEVLPPDLVNKWNQPGRRYHNLYGPTEAAIACTEYPIPQAPCSTSPPIGRPQLNRQVYVVDPATLHLQPRGVPGELLIGGRPGGLAYGYLNQPRLTATKFIPDPYHPDRIVYRSGDLVRWNPDHQLEFLGRIDNQVKLRGLRIELGEIEAALTSHPHIDRAVVLMRPDAHGENRLIGYYTTSAGNPAPAAHDLRDHLSSTLPDYMIPTSWVALDQFPLIAAWKINRNALPDPVETPSDDPDYTPPATPTEGIITGIFAEVLDQPRISTHHNFFDLGGSSLQAIRAISRINKTFDLKISIRTLYSHPTTQAVAHTIDQQLNNQPPESRAKAFT